MSIALTQPIRWVALPLLVWAAARALLARVAFWHDRPVDLTVPFLITLLPVVFLLLTLYFRPSWQRPVGLLCQSAVTGKCRWLLFMTILFNSATLVFCVRSWSRHEFASWMLRTNSKECRLLFLESQGGSVSLLCAASGIGSPYDRGGFRFGSSIPVFFVPSLGTFHFQMGPRGGAVQVPHLVLMVLAVLPIVGIAARKAHRAATQTPGKCRHCGYDLTGNTSGICPECGTAIPAAAMEATSVRLNAPD